MMAATTGKYFKLIFLILFFIIKMINAKQILRVTTFDEAEPSSSLTRGKRPNERLNLSYPGTKWCGPGNTASNYNDLGDHNDVDKCCRSHDHCDNIPSGSASHNLTNKDYFTLLHCDCDREFYQCLHSLNSATSNRVGKTYFTLRSKCYRNEFPIVECREYDTALFIRRCYRYVLDESKPQQYQWFDLPLYNGKQIVDRNADGVRVGDGVDAFFPFSNGDGKDFQLYLY